MCPRSQHTELAGEAPLQSLPGEWQTVQVPGAALGSRNAPSARACPLACAKACVGPAQAGLPPQAVPKRSQTPSSPGLGAQHEAGLGQAIHRDGRREEQGKTVPRDGLCCSSDASFRARWQLCSTELLLARCSTCSPIWLPGKAVSNP